jgi:TonB family protein
MRLAILTTLALLPFAASAQTVSQNGVLTAANSPAPVVHASVAAPAAATPSVAIAPVVRFHDVIAMTPDMDMLNVTDHMNGVVSHDFVLGARSSQDVSSPKLIHVVNRTLREEDALAGKDVTIRMTVKADGVPTGLKVIRSAGSEADKDTLAAVSQYRFQPGTLNHLPTESDVTIRLHLEK